MTSFINIRNVFIKADFRECIKHQSTDLYELNEPSFVKHFITSFVPGPPSFIKKIIIITAALINIVHVKLSIFVLT